MNKILIIILVVLNISNLYSQSYDEWVGKSFDYLEQDSLTQAEYALKQAMKLEPANSQNCLLLTNLGTIQRRLDKPQDALVSYSSALMIMPKSLTLLSSRASLFCELEQWNKAEEDYTTILYIDDNNEDALYRRGLVRKAKGDSIAAKVDFETILKYNPESAKARLGIADLLKNSGDFVMAAEMFSQVIKANQKQPDLYLRRAEIYYMDNKLSKAIRSEERRVGKEC